MNTTVYWSLSQSCSFKCFTSCKIEEEKVRDFLAKEEVDVPWWHSFGKQIGCFTTIEPRLYRFNLLSKTGIKTEDIGERMEERGFL